MRVTYVGHATLLLELGGTRILTDPNFEPKLGRVLPRVTPPGVPIEELGKLDALLLTHAHADHLSFDSLDRLPRDIPLFAPPAVQRWLKAKGYASAVPVAPGEEVRVGPVAIHAAAATHQGNRYGYDRWRAEANMYLLEGAMQTVFFAGDTALTANTHRLVEKHVHQRGRELDLALLPIGHAPWWKRASFRRGHLTTEDALTLFELLRARLLVPYHWGVFRHVTAGPFDAIRRLRAQLPEHPRRDAVRILEPGEMLDVTNA